MPQPPPRTLVVVIRLSKLRKSQLYGLVYSQAWTYRGVSHAVLMFRYGTLYHTATSRSELGYVAKRAVERKGVVYFSTP